jgi:hypothetical protein
MNHAPSFWQWEGVSFAQLPTFVYLTKTQTPGEGSSDREIQPNYSLPLVTSGARPDLNNGLRDICHVTI